MDDALLKAVVDELADTLPGARLHRAVQRGATDLLLDFKRKDGRWLIISTDANRLTLHLGKRPDRESNPPQRTDTGFVASLKKYFVDLRLRDISKQPDDRVVELDFGGSARLLVLLRGNAADVVISEDSRVVASLRNRERVSGTPQKHSQASDEFHPEFPTANEAAEHYFNSADTRLSFTREQQAVRSHLRGKVKKLRTLAGKLEDDRRRFQDGALHQRYGELLLVNLHQIQTQENAFVVVDVYDPSGSRILIPMGEHSDPRIAAEHYFKLARRSRNGLSAIDRRLPEVEGQISEAEATLKRIDEAENLSDLTAITAEIRMPARHQATGEKKIHAPRISGVRRYQTSEGFEILVGRSDQDNDNLTFRVAKSQDLWFHAADYPGSHVVLRNPHRTPPPQSAIHKAAQIAAKFSHARHDSKVAVNYCEKKFVSKLKRAAPGQVRISSFKTILVEPGEPAERIL
jgi:predicted ribosome quality control (RQC) complex YloA/Tae2 family protein